jgi:hypothetical protein
MAPIDRQHSNDFVRSAPGRGKSWRDWIKRKSTTQNSTMALEEELESKQENRKQQKQQYEEVETQKQQFPLVRRRTVSFAPMVETLQTLALGDYTKEEISASWFDDDDYYDISYNCRNIISKMNKKSYGSIKRNEDCIRGLERMTDIGLALRACNRNDSYDAVLEEQDVQWDNQEEDDHGGRIAQLYREVASRRCHVEAHQRGMQDALIAEELLLIDEGRKNKDEKEVQTAVCSMRMHQKRKSIQSPPAALSKVVPSAPSIPERMPARCVPNAPRMLAR